MGPNVSKNLKMLLLLQNAAIRFKTCPPPNGPHKTTFGTFETLSFPFYDIFIYLFIFLLFFFWGGGGGGWK